MCYLSRASRSAYNQSSVIFTTKSEIFPNFNGEWIKVCGERKYTSFLTRESNAVYFFNKCDVFYELVLIHTNDTRTSTITLEYIVKKSFDIDQIISASEELIHIPIMRINTCGKICKNYNKFNTYRLTWFKIAKQEEIYITNPFRLNIIQVTEGYNLMKKYILDMIQE